MTATDAPHLLYVAWGFPPSRGAGMYRALATTNAFARAGWQVTVLTPERAVFEQLTDLDTRTEASIDPSVTVVRVPFDLSRGETDLAQWSRFRIESPLGWSGLTLLRESSSFPEPRYGGWGRFLVPAARRVHAQKPVDLVIGTANPNVDFLPGWDLNRRFGIPYVMDYRDTWHLDMYSGRRTAPRTARSSRWEARLLKRAAEVWFVNAPILDWHVGQHPEIAEKAHVVSNGYDESFLTGLEPRIRCAHDPLSIGYLGTIYGPMPLEQTFEGWKRARARSTALATATLDIHGRLGHYANPDASVKAVLDRYTADGVRYHGKVSKTDVAKVYSSFDALALILGRSRYITSGKVFEYAATGLPIAALHHPETASTSVLSDYPRFVPASDDTAEAFADAFVELAAMTEHATDGELMNARESATRWERLRQLTPRIEELRQLVRRDA
ncbi:MAG: glycosyltransferase [Microcella pacifica]|uniref:glycosyltransferase n=1 Tax=Microcella pacifica TaxID=2591847 RepID=UPI00331548F9